MLGQNSCVSTASNADSADVLNETSIKAAGKTSKRRQVMKAALLLSSQINKQIAGDQKKEERRHKAEVKQKEADERLRQREIKQNETDNRFTSPELIRAIEDSFGKIDFDPCWHKMSAVRPKAYLDVRQGHNGLRDAWFGGVAFVNPPWSAQDKFVRRAHNEWLSGNVQTVVCLVPAKTDTVFFHQTLIKDADIYFIAGRPRFFKEDGTSEGTMVATMLVIFGATDQQKLRFAELVPGAWWLPSQSSTGGTEKASVSSLEATDDYGPVSCAAPPRNDASWIVFCNPSVGRDQAARLA